VQCHIITKYNDSTANKYLTRRIIMLSFLKKIFGAKPVTESPVPYKVEASEHFPFPRAVAEEKKPVAKKTAAKRSAVKKPAAKKPKA
jgi:hypothetical protein